MSVTINGSDSNVSAPAIAGTTSTAGVYFPSANVVAISTASTERMRVDSVGAVLINSTSFAYTTTVNINGSVYLTNGAYETWAGSYNLYNSANNYIGFQFFKGTSSLTGATRQAVIETQIDNKMNIKTDVNIPIYVIANASNGVYLSGGGTSWTSNSDERLKTNLKPIEDAANKVASLRAVTGRYKTDPETDSRAFLIAQDVQKVLPEAVNVQSDDIGTLGLQYTDVIPLLVAAIKELKAELDALKAKVK